MATDTLDILANSFKTPFLGPISRTTRSLLDSAQTLKKSKNDYTQLLEQVYQLIYAIIILHIKSNTGGELVPSTLNDIGKFMETLHKIHNFFDTQQDQSRIKQFFRQGEMNMMLKACNAELQQAIESFRISSGSPLRHVTDTERYAKKAQDDVIELIESLSDVATSDRASSINRVFSASHNSSNSISMLPSEPKIFHGRESELSEILKMFMQESARVAILGGGGMGKTTLAKVILHHSDIAARYDQHRYFVACDSASSQVELAALLGAHLGLKPGKDLTRAVVNHFSGNPSSLLILDNLETLWEPTESRGDIEEFLSLLTDIHGLSLIITMRGAERPTKVRWSRPFLHPLNPLRHEAARQTFMDIADGFHDSEDIDKVLLLTDNMPLAIDLIAHLVDSDGCSHVLARWEEEKTSLVSDGYDRRSNLDLSISLSLSSPRLNSLPHAKELLSLLAMLPDGISDTELIQSKLPIKDILLCKATLLRTSLVYSTDNQHTKTLVPIREYMQKFHPPSRKLIHPLLKHFQELLDIYNKYEGTVSGPGIVARIRSNFANIHSILLHNLQSDRQDLVTTIYCTCNLNKFSRFIGQGVISLMDQIVHVLPHSNDHKLELVYTTELLGSWRNRPIPDLEALVSQAVENLKHCEDMDVKCRFYNITGENYLFQRSDIPAALNFFEIALSLSISAGNSKGQANALSHLAWMRWQLGDYSLGRRFAYESGRVSKISADLYSEARALDIEASCWYSLGNYNHSISLLTKARDLLPLCGMSGSNMEHAIMNTQADVYSSKSDYLQAHHIRMQILAEAPYEQDSYQHALILLNIAEVDIPLGKPKEDVERNIQTAKCIFNTVGYLIGVTFCDMILADLYLREGDDPVAEGLLRNCLSLSPAKGAEIITYSLERLADPSRWTSGSVSSTWTTVFLAHALKSKQKLALFKALQYLGDLYKDLDTAVSLFTVALEGFTQMDVHCSRAECILRLGDVSKAQNNLEKAVELWARARSLFELSSQAKKVALIDHRLSHVNDVQDQNAKALVVLSDLHTPTKILDDQHRKEASEAVSRIKQSEI